MFLLGSFHSDYAVILWAHGDVYHNQTNPESMEGEYIAIREYGDRDSQFVPSIWTECHHILWQGPFWHMAQDRFDQNFCTSPTPLAGGIS